MTLIALDDEQMKFLKDALHYLIIKSEMRKNQGMYHYPERVASLRKIKEQVLRPLPVEFIVDNEPMAAEVINDKIIICFPTK